MEKLFQGEGSADDKCPKNQSQSTLACSRNKKATVTRIYIEESKVRKRKN